MPRRTVSYTIPEKSPDRMVWSGHIAGVAECASFFDVNPATFSNWAHRRDQNRMPLPILVMRSGTFYDLAELLPWWTNWTPVKGRRSGTVSRAYCIHLGLADPRPEVTL